MSLRKFNVYCVCLLSLAIFPSLAFCHGWGGTDAGAKAGGLGTAFTGLADDPTTIFYNPAGITQLDGMQFSSGLFLPYIKGTFDSYGTSNVPGDDAANEVDVDSELFIIPNVYFTSKFNDKLSFGFGQYANFGIGFTWPDSSDGRFAPGGKKGEVSTLSFSQVVAYKVNDKLSLAVAGIIHHSSIILKNSIFLGASESDAEVSGSEFGFGMNAAMLYKVSGELQVGLHYRSPSKLSFNDLDVKFSPQVPGLNNTTASMDITLPQYVSVGTAWSRGPLTLTCDVYWWDWSVIDELRVEYDAPVGGTSANVTPMDWDDTFSYALGAEYKVQALDREISLRSGFMYDTAPVPDSTVIPAGYQNDNILYDVGLGTQIGPVYCDFFIKYIYTKDRNWDNALGTVSPANPAAGQVTGEFKDYSTYSGAFNITYKF